MFGLFGVDNSENEAKLREKLKKTEDELEQCKRELNESISKYRTLVSAKSTSPPTPNPTSTDEISIGLLQSKLSETNAELKNTEMLLRDAMEINEELKKEIEDLKQTKAPESQPLPPTSEGEPELRERLEDTEAKLALCKKELNDAITKFRILVIDMSKTREGEKQTAKAINDKIDDLKRMNDQKNAEHAQEIALLEHSLNCCHKACKLKDDVIKQLKENLRNLENERLNDLKGIAAAHCNHKDLTAKEYKNLVEEVERLTIQNDQLDHALKEAQDKLRKIEALVQATTNKSDELTRRNQELTREFDRLNEELLASDQEKDELRNELRSTRQRLSELMKQNESLEEKLSQSKTQTMTLTREMKQARDSQGVMVDSLRGSLSSMDEQISTLRNEYQIIKTERENALIEINTLRKEVVEYKSNDSKIEQTRDAAVAAAAAASRQMEALMREMATREESYRAERNALMSKVEDLMTELQSKKEENSMLVRRVDKAVIDKNLEISNLMSVHQAESDAYKNEVNRLKDSITRVQFLKESLEQEVHGLRERQMMDRANIDDLERNKQQQREKLDEMTHQLISLKNDVTTAKTMQDRAEEETKNLRDELAKTRNKLADLDRAMSALQAAKSAMQQAYEQKMREMSVVTETITTSWGETKESVRNLEREKEAVRNRNIELIEETKRLQAEKDAALEMVAEQKNKIIELHEHTHTFTRQRLNPELQDKIDHLNKQLRMAQALSQELQGHMVPEEETVVTKTTSQRETTTDTQEKKSTNVKVGVSQDVAK